MHATPKLTPRLLLSAAALLACVAVFPAWTAESNTAEVEKLTAVLSSNAPQKEKADACRELARIGTAEAVAPLAALLPDEKLSHMARYALETIPSPEVDKAFRSALTSLHGRQLVGVIGSVGVRRDQKAVKELGILLKDADPDVAQTAARSLGRIGNSGAANAIQAALPGAAPANQLAFCEGLFRCAEALAQNGHRRQATAIYDAVRRLDSPHHQVRTAALRGAILTRQKAGLPILVEVLASPDYAVFSAAVRISFEVPGEPTTRALTAALDGASADRQVLLAQTLGTRGDSAALPALLASAKNSQKPVRLAAIRAIAQFGNPSTIAELLELSGGTDREISQAATEAFASLPGREADQAVMAMLKASDESRRNLAMDLVARRRMTSAIPDLLSAAAGPDPKFRVAAVKKVGELGDASQVPALTELLAKAATPEDLEATEQALSAVAVRAPDRNACAEQLAGSMSQLQPAQKCALVRVLNAVGGPGALKAIRTAVADPATEVRASAIRALGAWNGPEAAPDLLELARSAPDATDRMLSLRSFLGLAAQSELKPNDRLAMCRQAAALVQKDDEKKLLLAALGNITAPESIKLIQPYLDDEAVRQEAGTACVTVSEKILKSKEAAKDASQLLEPLQKVAESSGNAGLARRARGLLDQARQKAGGTPGK